MTYVEVTDIIDCDSCDSVIIGEGQHDTPHLTSLYHCDTAGPSQCFRKLDTKEI